MRHATRLQVTRGVHAVRLNLYAQRLDTALAQPTTLFEVPVPTRNGSLPNAVRNARMVGFASNIHCGLSLIRRKSMRLASAILYLVDLRESSMRHSVVARLKEMIAAVALLSVTSLAIQSRFRPIHYQTPYLHLRIPQQTHPLPQLTHKSTPQLLHFPKGCQTLRRQLVPV